MFALRQRHKANIIGKETFPQGGSVIESHGIPGGKCLHKGSFCYFSIYYFVDTISCESWKKMCISLSEIQPRRKFSRTQLYTFASQKREIRASNENVQRCMRICFQSDVSASKKKLEKRRERNSQATASYSEIFLVNGFHCICRKNSDGNFWPVEIEFL